MNHLPKKKTATLKKAKHFQINPDQGMANGQQTAAVPSQIHYLKSFKACLHFIEKSAAGEKKN